MTAREATRQLFARYRKIICAVTSHDEADARLSLENLAWMCRTAEASIDDLPLDKLSRWLGFVQGCLAMRGLIDVDTERDVSRPLFHAAYASDGGDVPATLERAADK